MNQARIQFRRVGPSESELVQSLLEQAPEYYRRTEGVDRVASHFGLKEIEDLPPIRISTYEKCFFVIYLDAVPIGVADLHRDHPVSGSCYLGLLLIIESLQHQGLGSRIYPHLESLALETLKASKMLLGVANTNDVSGFWLKMGFRFNGKAYIWKGENQDVAVREMEKELSTTEST